jgi:hypothetical protein
MQGNDFLYFFTDSTNRSFYVENGLVKLSSVPRPLQFTPGEWQNLLITNKRNQKYFALDRNFTIPLNAVEDGALILKDQFYKHGIETIVNLVILKQHLFYDGTEQGYHYKSFYKGEFDFGNFVHSGPIVTINVMEGGLSKLIKAKESTVYEIPMDHPDHEWIKMDGIILKEGVNFTAVDMELKKSVLGTYIIPPLIFSSSDSSQSPGVSFYSPNVESMTSNSFNYLHTSSNSIALAYPTNTAPVVLRITGPLYYKLHRNDAGLGIRLRFFKSSQTAANQNVYLVPIGGNTPGQTYGANVNFNISLEPGERLFFYLEYIGVTGGIDTSISLLPSTNLRIDYDFRQTTSYIRCLKPYTVFSELIKMISDGAYIPQSNVLALWDNLKITCGDAIRGLDGAILKTNLSDFFDTYNVDLDLAMGLIAGVLRMEYKADFIDYLNPIPLGSVKNLSVKPAKDYIYNTIVAGQRDITYDNVNGKQEFNSKVLWSTPNTRITKELNRLSPYRRDSFGIEFIRINLEGKTTTDNSGDNDEFVIHTAKIPYGYYFLDNRPVYMLDRTLNSGATGLIEPSTPFNLFFSPKRMLLRSGSFIRSLFYKQDSRKIVFQTSDKNKELISGGVIEKNDLAIGSLAAPHFMPIEISFETVVPIDLIETLEASPVRAFSFEYLGITYKGIPVTAGIKPADNESQTFILLSSPDNDLTQLINIFE